MGLRFDLLRCSPFLPMATHFSCDSFTLAVTYVFMNLFIGVILDGFDAATQSDTDVIKQEDFVRFSRKWTQYDPCATCYISVQVKEAHTLTIQM